MAEWLKRGALFLGARTSVGYGGRNVPYSGKA